VRAVFNRIYVPDEINQKDPTAATRSAWREVWRKMPNQYATEVYDGKSLIWKAS
jgi:hypothetical protein